jgi:hypothetical protein
MRAVGLVAVMCVWVSIVVVQGACVWDCMGQGMCIVGNSRLVSGW